MPQPSIIHSTFVVQSTYQKPVDRVFSAFSDPAKKRRWFAESDNHDVQAFEMDFQPGGTERLQYRFKEGTVFPGAIFLYLGTYQDIVPNKRIVNASTLALAGNRFSASLVTFEFIAGDAATDVICTHQGAFFEGSDGPALREKGWQALFAKLAKEIQR